MAGSALRYLIDLIEAAQAPWGISKTTLFDDSLQTMLARVPDLRDRLKRFIAIKLPNPLSPHALAGKHDRPFTAVLVGFWHCHLAADAILIYRLDRHTVQLVMLCQHAEIEGKRQKSVAKRLAMLEPA
jgi:mRNA-degrading endonuclease YafQ of YafQ-DinJ toxin-antitoxin module